MDDLADGSITFAGRNFIGGAQNSIHRHRKRWVLDGILAGVAFSWAESLTRPQFNADRSRCARDIFKSCQVSMDLTREQPVSAEFSSRLACGCGRFGPNLPQ